MKEIPKIIAIDDDEIFLLLIKELCKNIGYTITTFSNPEEAVSFIKSNGADIVLIDYVMPQLDGIEVIKKIRQIDPTIICVMITALGESHDIKVKAFEAGATEFLGKPFDPIEFQVRIKNLVQIKKAHNILKNFNKRLIKEVKRSTKIIWEREKETLIVLGKVAEYKDTETGIHIIRVAHYSKLLAEKIGFPKRKQEIIFYTSSLHDIGKIAISDSILLKPGNLTQEEWEIIKKHTIIGYEMLKDCENPYLRIGAIIALSHHERWDGTGYPQALKGENIPLYGRIVALADVFDALTSDRPYKKAWDFEKAMELIEKEKGKHFDPELAEIFISSEREVKEIFLKYSSKENSLELQEKL
ncbi:MAG: two-component system response regulator [Thermodesulfobacteriota bacterium]|nr:MAG: two-component system response regulator [Thermodesulfobacteriota bacterium]